MLQTSVLERESFFLIAPVPDLCLLVPFHENQPASSGEEYF